MTVDELRLFKIETAAELRAYAGRALDAADILDPGPRARRKRRAGREGKRRAGGAVHAPAGPGVRGQ